MQFLVRLVPHIPDSLSGDDLSELYTSERERASALLTEGKLARMWRIPGTPSGLGLWDVSSPEELHELLSSLPSWKYCEIEIIPLIQHPLEADVSVPA